MVAVEQAWRVISGVREVCLRRAAVAARFVGLGALSWVLACSGSTQRGEQQTAGSSGSSAQTGGTQAASGGSAMADAGAVGMVGGEGGSSGGTAESGGACEAGSVLCDGDLARTCVGTSYGTPVDCTAEGKHCAAELGCVMCDPGSKRCEGDTAIRCKPDGSGYTVEVCDPLQGLSCDTQSGKCQGLCSSALLGSAYIGCDYFPTVTANEVADDYHFAVAVSNASDGAATVMITRGSASVDSFSVPAGSVVVRTLPWVDALKGPDIITASLVLADGAYRLRSNRPVTVYQFSPLEYTMGQGTWSASNDASLLLPVSSWTGKYWVVARHNWGTNSADNYRGFYTVTAAFDGTQVKVKPGPLGAGVLLGAPGIDASGNGMVTLNAGDVLSVYTDGPGTIRDPQDVTGTLVEADKAVQVIGGHQCTNVPDDVTFCDHLEESMFPAQTLATSYYVTAPLIPDGTAVPKVQVVRVLATQDATTLTYDPPQLGAPTTIPQAGGWVELASSNSDYHVTADKPVSVVQYMEGQNAGGGAGDPAMALTVTESQYRKQYLIHAPTNYPTNYANIVAPSSATVTVDGVDVDAAQFQTIGSSGYSVIRLALSNAGDGNHTIVGSKPVGVTVYGYGQVTSYWYPGGLNLNDLTKPGNPDQ